MLRLTVEVPQARDRTAFAALRDGARIVASAHAVASATPAYAANRANPPAIHCGRADIRRSAVTASSTSSRRRRSSAPHTASTCSFSSPSRVPRSKPNRSAGSRFSPMAVLRAAERRAAFD